MNDLKKLKEKYISVLAPEFPAMDVAQFKACVTCTATLYRDQVPRLSNSNGFIYPPYPMHLPPLDCIRERLCGPKTSIYATQKTETSDGRMWYCRASYQCTGRCEYYGNDITKAIGRRL
jgi:hypothetical protein